MIISNEKRTTTEVNDWPGLHLLHFQGSTCSQKVRLILGELKLDWVSHPINLIKHENTSTWFLGINPRGLVPVLVDNGVVHVESNDIITYLDSQYATAQSSYFFAVNSTEAEKAQALLDLEDSLHADLRLLTIKFGPLSLKNEKQISNQEHNGITDEKRNHEIDWWREKLNNGITEAEISNAIANFSHAFEQLDHLLINSPWLMGDTISIVDITWYVNIQRLLQVGYPLHKHPTLNIHYKKLASRPSFKADSKPLNVKVGRAVFAACRLINYFKSNKIENYIN
jgi:glutathione S-transferase